jgi:hypothetical protein
LVKKGCERRGLHPFEAASVVSSEVNEGFCDGSFFHLAEAELQRGAGPGRAGDAARPRGGDGDACARKEEGACRCGVGGEQNLCGSDEGEKSRGGRRWELDLEHLGADRLAHLPAQVLAAGIGDLVLFEAHAQRVQRRARRAAAQHVGA